MKMKTFNKKYCVTHIIQKNKGRKMLWRKAKQAAQIHLVKMTMKLLKILTNYNQQKKSTTIKMKIFIQKIFSNLATHKLISNSYKEEKALD